MLAARERARAELGCKLSEKGYSSACVNAVLDRLEAEHLQSDERYAEEFVAQRIRRGLGPLRIAAELRDKGISEELIAAWVETNDSAWSRRMAVVAAGRFGDAAATDRRELAKRARFLEYRGFPAELIRHYLFD